MLIEYSSSSDDSIVDEEDGCSSIDGQGFDGIFSENPDSIEQLFVEQDVSKDQEANKQYQTRSSIKQREISTNKHCQYSNDDRLSATRLPEPPDSFFNSYLVTPRRGDDSELHEGRSRAIAHTEGLWPSHVFISIALPDNVRCAAERAIQKANVRTNGQWNSLLTSLLDTPRLLHISLSQQLMLPTERKIDFSDAITRSISNLKR